MNKLSFNSVCEHDVELNRKKKFQESFENNLILP